MARRLPRKRRDNSARLVQAIVMEAPSRASRVFAKRTFGSRTRLLHACTSARRPRPGKLRFAFGGPGERQGSWATWPSTFSETAMAIRSTWRPHRAPRTFSVYQIRRRPFQMPPLLAPSLFFSITLASAAGAAGAALALARDVTAVTDCCKLQLELFAIPFTCIQQQPYSRKRPKLSRPL